MTFQNSVCLEVKLWCVVGSLLVGLAGYLTVELLEWTRIVPDGWRRK